MRSYVDREKGRGAIPTLKADRLNSSDLFERIEGDSFLELTKNGSYKLETLLSQVRRFIGLGFLPNVNGGYYEQPSNFWDVYYLFRQVENIWMRRKEGL